MEDLDALLADLQATTTAHLQAGKPTGPRLEHSDPSPPGTLGESSPAAIPGKSPGKSPIRTPVKGPAKSPTISPSAHKNESGPFHSNSSHSNSDQKQATREEISNEVGWNTFSSSNNRDSGGHSPPPPVPPHPIEELDEDAEDAAFESAVTPLKNAVAASAAAATTDVMNHTPPKEPSPGRFGVPCSASFPPPRRPSPQFAVPLTKCSSPSRGAEPGGSGRRSGSTLSSNLSELDSLLESLNSAHLAAEAERRSAAAERPSPPPSPPKVSASDARKELDDLMASLSEFHPSQSQSQSMSHSQSFFSQSLTEEDRGGGGGGGGGGDGGGGGGNGGVGSRKGFGSGGAIGAADRSGAGAGRSEGGGVGGLKGSDGAIGAGGVDASPKSAEVRPSPPKSNETREKSADGGRHLDSMLCRLEEEARRQGVDTAPKGHCRTCKKAIIGQVVTAIGSAYHPEHFICTHCNKELGSETFFERDSQPYCEECCHYLFSPRCAYCEGPITGKCMSALDKTWHPDHFFCGNCGTQFGEEEFHEKEEKVYCKKCFFELFAARCKACGEPIESNYISALDGHWHNECFTCRECLMPFTGGSYFEHEGQPYCEVHYHARRGSLCAGCQSPITGRCITAMGRKYHPEHFVCSFCLKPLKKGTFKEQSDKPYCHQCFNKLFG